MVLKMFPFALPVLGRIVSVVGSIVTLYLVSSSDSVVKVSPVIKLESRKRRMREGRRHASMMG